MNPGNAPGNSTRRKSVARLKWYTLASSNSRGSRLRTPSRRFTYTRPNTPTVISPIFIVSPMPNTTMNSGASAGNGTARSIWIGLSMMARPTREAPATSPVGTARMMPNARPEATRSRLIPIEGQSRPSASRSFQAPTTSAGDGRGRVSAGESVAKYHHNSRSSVEAQAAATAAIRRRRACLRMMTFPSIVLTTSGSTSMISAQPPAFIHRLRCFQHDLRQWPGHPVSVSYS